MKMATDDKFLLLYLFTCAKSEPSVVGWPQFMELSISEYIPLNTLILLSDGAHTYYKSEQGHLIDNYEINPSFIINHLV